MTAHHRVHHPSHGFHTVVDLMRICGRLLRGLLAFVVLLALVAGLPWALAHFVGWPLPDHLPTWDAIQATLLNPMSARFLLDVLACLCWIVWFFFALDVLRCTIDAIRGITWPQVRPPGPLHGLATALIGTTVLTLLGNRTPYTLPTTSLTLISDLTPVVVTAPLHPGPAQPVAVVRQTTLTIDAEAPAAPGMVQITEEVRLPQDGIYDSLSRVAERIFGDPNRWPELYQLNRGVEQADGRALTNPNLVRPGWKITAYIPTPAPPVEQLPDDQQPPVPPQQPSPSTNTPTAPPPSTQPAPTTHAPAETDRTDEHGTSDNSASGLDLVTGAFVSLGLAGLITAAVVSARMRRRRRYRIGSGDRTDLHRPIAPVVRALRTAHDQDDGPISVDDVEFIELAPAPPARILITRAGAIKPNDDPVPIAARIGVRGGRELALNLASTRGLGLLGPGATATARGLLLHLLAEKSQHGGNIRVLVPATDLDLVFDDTEVENLPSTLLVVESLDAALDEMEAALLTRTRHLIEETNPRPATATLVLLGSPVPHAERRLQAVLDNGSNLSLAGILLGQWRPGVTVRVRPDGTVSATSLGPGDALTGMRLFTLPATDAAELLAVLREAEGPADVASGAVDHDEEIRLVDDRHEDRDLVQALPVPEQQAAEDLTQLESSRPLETDDGDQADPVPNLQLLDDRPAPLADVAEDHHRVAAADTVSDNVEPADRPSLHAPETPRDESAEEAAPRPLLALRVLGHVELVRQEAGGEQELGGALTPKQREVLVYLALHPLGVRREALNDAVWPDSRPPRPFNSLHNALSLLRRALSTVGTSDLVLNDDGRYHLNTELVTTDYQRLQHALQAPRSTGDSNALAPLREAVDLYQADLAEDLTAPWVEPFRESLRRDVLDALGVLIRAHGETDPETTLMLLERTRKLDRYNESVYRDIVRTQARLGQYDAIQRTLALLATTLDDIGQQPSGDTLNLGDFLQRRGSARRQATPSDNAAAS